MANDTARVYRSDEGFVLQLIEPLFNKLALDRSPDVIASPRSEVEVVNLIREASQQGWKVAVRSGGHSWIASSVRSGGLLLDMSAFNSISIDATTRTAKVGPAVRNAELVKALAAEGLAFPVGHCGTPGIGGFLLGGGIGLNWGHWKPACFSVRSVRVVMADGRLVVASELENSELLWLARGSGPGFPGVITEFEIECQTRPADTRVSSWLFDIDSLNQVTGWVVNASRNLPSNVVVGVSTFGPERPMLPPSEGVPSHLVGVTAIAYVDSEEEAREVLNALREGPGCSSVFQSELAPVPFEMLNSAFDATYPENHHYLADTFWTPLDVHGAMSTISELIREAPSGKSFVLAVMPGHGAAGQGLPDKEAAYSMDERTVILTYAIWKEAADDQSNRRWMKDVVAKLEPISKGHFLSEADLHVSPQRASRCFSQANWQRLIDLRRVFDPHGTFHGFPGAGFDKTPSS